MADPELDAVERSVAPLALADTDAQLEAVLRTLLPGLLAALPTPSTAARTRITQTLQHINVRLRAAHQVALPLDALVTLFKDSAASDITKNVILTGGYMEKAFDRCPHTDLRKQLSVRLIAGCTAYSKVNIGPTLRLAIRSVGTLENQTQRQHILKLIREAQQSPRDLASFVGYALRALLRELSPELIEQEMISLVHFLAELSPTTVCPHLIVASADVKSSRLASAGEDALARMEGSPNIEKPILVDAMFNLFNRNSSALRCQVLSKVLLRSAAAADRFPGNLAIVRESIYGKDATPKLRTLGMSFASWIVRHASVRNLDAHALQLVQPFVDTIQRPDEFDVSSVVRNFAFSVVSDLAFRRKALFSESDLFPTTCLNVACSASESEESRSAAVQALLSLSTVYKESTLPTKTKLLGHLQATVDKFSTLPTPTCMAVMKLICSWFSFDNSRARILCLGACADHRKEVVKVAIGGLSPATFDLDRIATTQKDFASIQYPAFGELLSLIEGSDPDIRAVVAGRKVSLGPSSAVRLKESLWLLVRALEFAISGGSRTVSTVHDESTRRAVLEDSVLRGTVSRLYIISHATLLATREGIRDRSLGELADMCLLTLLHVIESTSFQNPLVTVDMDTVNGLWRLGRERSGIGLDALCKYTGFLCRLVDPKEFEVLFRKSLQPCLASLRAGGVESHGEIVMTAEILGQLTETHLAGMSLSLDDRKGIRGAVLDMLRGDSFTVGDRVVAAQSFGALIQRRSVLEELLPSESGHFDIKSLVEELLQVLKEEKLPVRVADAILTSATKLFMVYRNSDEIESFIRVATRIGQVKGDENLSFSIGEGLVRLAFGHEMNTGKRLLDDDAGLEEILETTVRSWVSRVAEQNDFGAAPVAREAIALALKLSNELCRHVRPSVRAAGCIFTFSLLRHAESLRLRHREMDTEKETAEFLPEVDEMLQDCLPDCQAAFSLLLSERNDFTQQLAAKGLTIVYNLSDESLRADMVSSLVRSLTSSRTKATASNVAGDEGGIIELEGSGAEGPSSYKELCQVCNDMGKPELIYKFLDIAGHGTLWNNRRGAALVGESIFKSEVASQELKPHFAVLFPKLYLYSYDPAPGVRMSMTGILKSMTEAVGLTTVGAALQAYLDPTFEFLLTSMGSHQWRIREAAATGLRDALASRKFSEVERFLDRVWYMVFRNMDDIKESVRKAGEGCARAARALCERLCDPRLTAKSDASRAALIVVPICLKGYTSGVKESQAVSVGLLTDIIKNGGDHLRELVPEVVQCLLSSATELEPPILSYAQFHVEAPDELEARRVEAAASSQGLIASSLDRLLPLVDHEVARSVTPMLVNLARSGVGIPTRVSTAQFVSSLMTTNRGDVAEEAMKLMDATLSAVFAERTAPLIKYWALAAVHCASVATPPKASKFFNRVHRHAASEDEASRNAAAVLCVVLSNKRPELLKSYSAQILPAAFLGKVLITNDTAEHWRQVWSDNVASESSGVRTFGNEIVDLCEKWLLESRSHVLRKASANALRKVVSVLASSEESKERVRLLERVKTLLCQSLRGGLWDGRDVLFTALGAFSERRDSDLVNAALVFEGDREVVALLCAEAERGSSKSRVAAIQCLRMIVASLDERREAFSDVVAMTSRLLGRSDGHAREVTSQVLSEALRCIEASLDRSYSAEQFAPIADVIERIADDKECLNAELGLVRQAFERWKGPALSGPPCTSAARIVRDGLHSDDSKMRELAKEIVRVISVLEPRWFEFRNETLKLLSEGGDGALADQHAELFCWSEDATVKKS